MYAFALVLSLICWVSVTFYFLHSGNFSVFHPLTYYTAFHGLVFVIRPIFGYFLEYRIVYYAYQFVPSASDKLIVIFASNLGFLVFSAACLFRGNIPMVFKQTQLIVAERNRLLPAYLWTMVVCAPLGAYSLYLSFKSAGEGTRDLATAVDKGTGVIVNTDSNGYLFESKLMVASAAALFAWLFRFRPLSLMPLATFIILRSGTGGRGPFVQASVTLLLLWLYEHRRKLPSPAVMLAVVAIIPLFNLVGADRGRAIRQLLGSDNTVQESTSHVDKTDAFLEDMDLGNMEMFELLVYAIPQRTHTYSYFLDNLQVFTEPIPRMWWKGKPAGAPFNHIFLMDYSSPVGMTRSLPGEGWYCLGWAGVIIMCGAWGLALGWIYRRYVEGSQGTIQTAFYMVFVPILIVAYRDGLILTVFRQGLFFFAPIVIWYTFSRYLGIPSAQEEQRLLSFQRARQIRRQHAIAGPAQAVDNDQPEAGIETPQPAPRRAQAASYLPPAAARRRAILQGDQ